MAAPSFMMRPAFAVLASILLCTACSREEARSAPPAIEIVDVTPTQAADLIARGEARVLDVRSPEEFALGHIEGAINQNVNAEGFVSALEQLPDDKPFIVHCAAGSPGGRSRRATEALQSAGASQIYHLNGGFSAWSREGHPTVAQAASD
ncbi:MAG: rhodanese-like domain-containing protein [Myxococcota bacterium]